MKVRRHARSKADDESEMQLAAQQDQAAETQTGELLGDRVGDKWFAVRDRGHWWRVRQRMLTEKLPVRICIPNAAARNDPDKMLGEFEKKLAKQLRSALTRRTAPKLVLKAFLAECERGFGTLCDYLDWLLPYVLEGRLTCATEAEYREALFFLFRARLVEERTGKEVWACDVPERFAKVLAGKERFVWPLTALLLTDGEFRDAVLLLYFKYPESVRSTKDDKASRRPLFNALREVGLYFENRKRLLKLQDVIACRFAEIKDLRGLDRTKKVYALAGLKLEPYRFDAATKEVDRLMTKFQLPKDRKK